MFGHSPYRPPCQGKVVQRSWELTGLPHHRGTEYRVRGWEGLLETGVGPVGGTDFYRVPVLEEAGTTRSGTFT